MLHTMDPGPFSIQEDLVLKLSDDGKFLQAEFPTALNRRSINYGWFQEQLVQRGLDQFKLNKDAIGNFIREYNEGTSASTINIAEKLDGEFQIRIADNLMAAYLSINPPQGGEPISKAMIVEKLQALGITSGLQDDEIDLALQIGVAHDVVIAKGQEPEHGKDGCFENLIPDAKDRRPHIDEQGIAHYHDIGELVTVKPGDPLMRRVPATPGKPGLNIKGQVVPANPGAEMMFAPNLSGTEFNADDSHLLQAAIAGQPVVVENGAIVEKTIIVDNVNLSTGNIKFDGTVVVKGDVNTGFAIKTSGDVYVRGMVEEAACIEAGGDIEIAQGAIGRGSISEENGQPGKGIVFLRCAGSLSAKFLENCVVWAGKEINVTELVAHSDITAKQQVTVGQKNARRGQIMGGVTRSDLLVLAQIVGTKGGNHTKVEVGPIQKYESRLTELEETLQSKFVERKNIEKVFSQAAKIHNRGNEQNQPPFLKKLQDTLHRLGMEISSLNHQKTQLEEYLEKLRFAKIVINKQVLNAVEFMICDTPRKFNLEHVGGTFRFDNKESKVEFLP